MITYSCASSTNCYQYDTIDERETCFAKINASNAGATAVEADLEDRSGRVPLSTPLNPAPTGF